MCFPSQSNRYVHFLTRALKQNKNKNFKSSDVFWPWPYLSFARLLSFPKCPSPLAPVNALHHPSIAHWHSAVFSWPNSTRSVVSFWYFLWMCQMLPLTNMNFAAKLDPVSAEGRQHACALARCMTGRKQSLVYPMEDMTWADNVLKNNHLISLTLMALLYYW